MHNNLTQYPEGSIRELWKISLPLMISSLASLFMIFTDRIFLAHYSIEALNASVTAGTFAWALMAGVGTVTAMSEVFVAQYNGARHFKRLGLPIWQMVWVALFSILFFFPIAIWGAPMVFGTDRYADLEVGYFRVLMFFSPAYALLMAFSGFFIGRGKTKVLIWLAIVANLINIILDRILIFGIPGIVPEMGIHGAAVATCFGYLFESAALGYLFLKKENREFFGAACWRFNWKEMKKCLRIGFPQGLFYALEVFGWSVFYWMMTDMGEKHITISSICQSFTILLSFFSEGLSRGAAAVAGNFMGSKRYSLVPKVLKSGFVLVCFFSVITAAVFIADPVDTVRVLFIQELDTAFQTSLKTCMIMAFVYIFFEGLRWLFSGLLIAAGDTLFLLVAGSLSVWAFLLAPIYWVVVKQNLPIEYAWGLTVLYAAVFFAVYWIRFNSGSWQRIDLVTHQEQQAGLAQEGSKEDKTSKVAGSTPLELPESHQQE